MAKLVWDAAGARKFETGCDRGVLYLPAGTAISWNGLTSVEENPSDVSVSEYYLDGVKYLNDRSLGDFSGTIKAFTYPDEFMPFDSMLEFATGLIAADQQVSQMFGLSYRTKVGNDVSGTDFGYKIHILYNLTAQPSTKSYASLAGSATPTDLSWTIQGTPVVVAGFRPTCHVVVDSTRVTAGKLANVENALYGTAGAAPYLPSPATLITL